VFKKEDRQEESESVLFMFVDEHPAPYSNVKNYPGSNCLKSSFNAVFENIMRKSLHKEGSKATISDLLQETLIKERKAGGERLSIT
jgi:hypothetical protein